MKIVVFGNVGSGKTTLCRLLRQHTGYQYVSIDQMRRTYSDGSVAGEQRACNAFYEKVLLLEPQILECLGVGQVTDQLYQIVTKTCQPLICLILMTSKEICLRRLDGRVWNIPFWKPVETVYPLIERVDYLLRTGQIAEQWAKRADTLILVEINEQPEDLARIVQLVNDIINRNEAHG